MTDSGFSLPKASAAQMVDDYFKGDMKHVKTVYDGNTFSNSSGSLRDQSGTALREFTDSVSPALKRMQVAYLTQVRENCYQEHHISDDFTNEEQIDMCKKEQHHDVFGEY